MTADGARYIVLGLPEFQKLLSDTRSKIEERAKEGDTSTWVKNPNKWARLLKSDLVENAFDVRLEFGYSHCNIHISWD